ncbi:hypothetical protein [Pedobacter antarcticus]|uniref:Uncharacterized protein n=2 Tax=Pedobacter antarcticus TaxID=34086 RepID=A0A081PKE3_9SPHI|nr:hypothetical protein [Pedobacter antarcticus]KEQ31166.1 hypothetical protein N180_02650 [Pedobacter antarcticus 4BY]SDM90987.1 hypothetical protein SAMN04488084_11914 [Pedobacter antarcticus]SFE53815.1 hypothetical protein SAMN03003324_00821 [Pedobacter antarcticus]
MKLAFGTSFHNQPNYFIEKIWRGLLAGSDDFITNYQNYQRRYLEKFGVCWDGEDFGEFMEPKLHTIRKDLDNEWSAGKTIQLVINLNATDEFQFAPQITCTSVQRIHIDYSGLIKENGPAVFIDYELLDQETLAKLAINDGFPTIADFFLYFNEEFAGNLVHWTPIRY